LCENGPEIVEKKAYTVAHSIPDVTPRKNKKVRSVRGYYYMQGLPVIKSELYENRFDLNVHADYVWKKNE
jgi:hypothetical protein